MTRSSDPAAGNVDVLYVVALREEFEPARDVVFKGFLNKYPGVAAWIDRDEDTTTPYTFGKFIVDEQTSFTVALVELSRMGDTKASRVLGTLSERLRPACLAMSGVCAGYPDRVALGDLIVAEPSYHRLEGKMTQDGLQADVRTSSPSPRWARAAGKLDVGDLSGFGQPTRDESKRWFLECLFEKRDPYKRPERSRYLKGDAWGAAVRDLIDAGLIVINDFGKTRLSRAGRAYVERTRREDPDWPYQLPFQVFVGPMATAPYVDASNPWEVIVDGGVRTVIGLEMEAASVGSAAYDLDMRFWIVCKGVMDFAMPAKNDRYKKMAARASAELVWKFLAEQRLRHPETMNDGAAASRSSPESVRAALPASNLPDSVDELVGRAVAFQQGADYLSGARGRLLTVVGPPGAGKTRLAIEVAHSLRAGLNDRVYLVDLSATSEPDLVFAGIADSLKIEAGDPLIDALRELFRETPALIILDNFEEGPTATPRVAELLRVAPDLSIVVTSQAPLRLRQEKIVEVGALDPSDAEELFITRAAASMTSPAAREAVAALCRVLDGLPLAIELVAAHAGLLTPQHLSRVGGSKDLNHLKNLMRDASVRHDTVSSAISWSFERLDRDQQDLFVELAVFDGGWTSSAAAYVVSGLSETIASADLMRPLLDRRFVYVEDPGDTDPRFRMLSPLREFGVENLAGRGDLKGDLNGRHARYFRDFVQANAADLNGVRKPQALALIAREHANVHAALEHFIGNHDARSALQMAAALDAYWWSRNYREGLTQLTSVLALELPEDSSREDRILSAKASLAAGKLALRQFRLNDARRHFAAVRTIAVQEGDRELEAASLERDALVDIEQRMYDDARGKLVLALEIDDAEGNDEHAADCLDGLGAVESEAGDYERARELFEAALRRYPRSAGRLPGAWVRVDLGQLALLEGRLEDARVHAQYAHDLAEEKDLGIMMWADHTLGLVDTAEANYAEARAHLSKSLTQAMLLGNLRPRLRALEGFAVLAAADGQCEAALTLIAAMDEIRAQINLPRARTEEAMIDNAIRSSEGTLSHPAQMRARDAGGQKTLEQATEFAREI